MSKLSTTNAYNVPARKAYAAVLLMDTPGDMTQALQVLIVATKQTAPQTNRRQRPDIIFNQSKSEKREY